MVAVEGLDRYALLLDTLDSLGEGVFVLAGLQVEWANSAVARIAGRAADDLIGLDSALEVIDERDRELVGTRIGEALSTGERVRFEARVRRPDGTVVWVELAGRPLLGDGRLRIIGVARDIDARKQSEFELAREHRRASFFADVSPLLEASLDLPALLAGVSRLLVERGVCAACAFELAGIAGWRRVAVAPERSDVDAAAALVLPLVAGGERLGRLLVEDPVALAIAEELAERVAPVVANVRLFGERARVARVLQDSLLPPELPDVPGLMVATRYVAGAARLDVGGDFYDVFPSGASAWNAVVGDVCGQGAEAAAMTALARHTLRTLALRSDDPAELLGALNVAIVREMGDEMRFITMVLARLVPQADRVRLDVACAGHPPPFVARGAGRAEEIDNCGPLLGVLDGAAYATTTVELARGDVAVLYTDGLSEAARADTGDGYLDVPGRLRADGPEAVAAGLEEWARERGGGELEDDLALLVLGAR